MNIRVLSIAALTVATSMVVSLPIRAQETGSKAAQTSVETWLALVDRQDYSASWQSAASYFRNAITGEKWQEAVRAARMPLGPLKARTLKSTTETKTLPGAPDGEYVVFQFNTGFDQKAAAVETVTAMREKDGNWRVAGYFIR